MAREDPTIYMRIPADLKDQLDTHAKNSGRSLTAEVVGRLQSTFDATSSNEVVVGLATDLAKVKKEAAFLAYGRQEKLMQLMLLYDVYRDLVEALELLGITDIPAKSDRNLADSIGAEANDELMRQNATLEPYFLYDNVKRTDHEFQKQLARLAESVVGLPVPTNEEASHLQVLRDRLWKRREKEHAEGKYIRDPANETKHKTFHIELKNIPQPSKQNKKR